MNYPSPQSSPPITTCDACSCNLTLSPSPSNSYSCDGKSLSSIISFGEYICPQQFRNLADWVYQWEQSGHSEAFDQGPIEPLIDCFPERSIIYVRVWYAADFFNEIYPLLKKNIVLITGEGDLSVPFDEHLTYLRDHELVSHWFGQNGKVVHSGDRFSKIPIGLNCHEHVESLETVRSRFSNYSIKVNSSEEFDPKDPFLSFPLISFDSNSLLLLNFDPGTDGTNSRRLLWERACSESGQWKSFSVCRSKDSGVKQYISSLPDIYEDNMKIPFWLSPRGNGVDCHRTWEALYLGRIPVILTSDIDELFQDLPVLLVNSWDEISKEFLLKKYDEIMSKRRRRRFNFRKLDFSFWKEKILAQTFYGNSSRPGRCWSPK